ncbi:MAG TPA: cytochrome c oxidase subunit I, partial [Pyrinomonadaceae bacterium]|nr:cytochrome c oxidase subunit I [Pyrinomonadaceae bacterium]
MKTEVEDATVVEEEEVAAEQGEKEEVREGDLPEEEERRLLEKTWGDEPGLRGWLTSTNHKSIGKRFIVTAFVFFLLGGVLAVLMRLQLARPENTFLGPDAYNQIFTMHGTTMMFLFAIPVMGAFATYLVPLMIGTRNIAFPRLAAFSYWIYLSGGVTLYIFFILNIGPDMGWFSYPPLAGPEFSPGKRVDIWSQLINFTEISALATAVEIITTVFRLRAPGLSLHRIPVFVWAMLVMSFMVVFAMPAVMTSSLFLTLDRLVGTHFYNPAEGGDPLLWQHLFWFFGHPEVYIIFIPALGFVSSVVQTFSRRKVFGYTALVLSMIATGFIGFGLWVHHMFTTGLPGISLGLFSAASEAVAIPTGVQIFCFIATLAAGRVVRSVPMLFAFGSLVIFVLGGLTGVMVAVAPFDFQAHDTFFVVGHFHYVLIGGALFPIFAGCYYFFPLVSGKRLSDRLGRVGFWLAFVGFNVAFLPMHLTGLRGMPRRVFTYPAGLGFDALNLTTSVGAFVLAAGVAVIFWDLVRPKKHQPYSERNPWRAGTLEWLQEMPGKPWGIRSIPEIDSRYPLWDQPDLTRDVDEGRFYLPDAEEGRRETIVSSVIDARPEQCLRLPGSSFVPALAALTTGGFFIFGTYHLWGLASASLSAATGVIVYWLWTGTAAIPEKEEKDVGLGLRLPLYVSGPQSVGWWAMFITMLAVLTAFVSLVFGYFFFWTVHEDFPPTPSPGPGGFWPTVAAALLLGAWALTLLARRWNRLDWSIGFYAGLLSAVGLSLAGGAALLAGPWAAGLDPASHVYPATVWVLVIWTAFQAAVGVVMQLYCVARRLAGRMTARYDM